MFARDLIVPLYWRVCTTILACLSIWISTIILILTVHNCTVIILYEVNIKMTFDSNLEYISQTQTLIGSQRKRFLDIDTGEHIEVDQITKRALGQKQFWKVYLIDFLQVLGVLDSKQVDVLIFILENTKSSDNTFIGTYRKISEGANVALETVRKVMHKLQRQNDQNGIPFIKRIQNGVYQVSPLIMMKGSEHKKSLLLNYYQDPIKKQ